MVSESACALAFEISGLRLDFPQMLSARGCTRARAKLRQSPMPRPVKIVLHCPDLQIGLSASQRGL